VLLQAPIAMVTGSDFEGVRRAYRA